VAGEEDSEGSLGGGMPFFHVIATLPGQRKKTLDNRSEEEVAASVLEFLRDGTITAQWKTSRTYQALELRVYQTTKPWHRPTMGPLEEVVAGHRNLYPRFEKQAQKLLGLKTHRVFIVMPIQGKEYGSQEEQRVFAEYNQRFEVLEKLLSKWQCVAIRIDKEVPLQSLVGRIKEEINRARFVIADLTDERPSCYFEIGYAEGLDRRVLLVASEESVVHPGTKTKIHFDIHQNVNFFVNHKELRKKVDAALAKNRDALFEERSGGDGATSKELATAEG
jgi:hypothetical protein